MKLGTSYEITYHHNTILHLLFLVFAEICFIGSNRYIIGILELPRVSTVYHTPLLHRKDQGMWGQPGAMPWLWPSFSAY